MGYGTPARPATHLSTDRTSQPISSSSAFAWSPETWRSSWTASIPMRRTDVPMYEYACHEGNYAMPNILAGQRAEEKAATAKP